MKLSIVMLSLRVTDEDRDFLDPDEYAACAGKWCHSVNIDGEDEGGGLVLEFISPDYEEAAEFAIALARERRCVLLDQSQEDPEQ